MSTYTQILYQIVFSTKNRKRALSESKSQELLNYIWGIIKNHNSHLYRINCVEDHIHILIHLHPSVSLASLVKDIKVSSSKMIKEDKLFPKFDGWQRGYGAFTYSIDAKDNLIEYIVNQKNHHRKISFEEEYKSLLEEFKIKYDEQYLE
jgi:REP element-mobilizing transposase RayT